MKEVHFENVILDKSRFERQTFLASKLIKVLSCHPDSKKVLEKLPPVRRRDGNP